MEKWQQVLRGLPASAPKGCPSQKQRDSHEEETLPAFQKLQGAAEKLAGTACNLSAQTRLVRV